MSAGALSGLLTGITGVTAGGKAGGRETGWVDSRLTSGAAALEVIDRELRIDLAGGTAGTVREGMIVGSPVRW